MLYETHTHTGTEGEYTWPPIQSSPRKSVGTRTKPPRISKKHTVVHVHNADLLTHGEIHIYI